MLVVLTALFLLAIAVTMVRSPQGVVVSADPGYDPVPVPLLLIPAALASLLVLLLPAGNGSRTVMRTGRGSVAGESVGLLALALAFPLLVPVLPLPEDYVLLKLVLLVLVPVLVLAILRRRRGSSVHIDRPRVAPWVLLLPPLVLGTLTTVGPFTAGAPESWPPVAMLLVAATATAITASFGEEVFFRRLLQTRAEALVGPWTGLLLATLLFALMHVPSHGDGPVWARAFQAIALQGTTGLALGLMWHRWRRLWPCVLAHLLLNGFGVLLHLLGLLG